MDNTIRIFAHQNLLEIYDKKIKNILYENFKVLRSCEIYDDNYEICGKVSHLENTKYAILFMSDSYTNREPIIKWFNKMIHPITDYAEYTYIIMRSVRENFLFPLPNNVEVIYLTYISILPNKFLNVLEKICDNEHK